MSEIDDFIVLMNFRGQTGIQITLIKFVESTQHWVIREFEVPSWTLEVIT